ncbi:kinase [Bacillus methanolicus]|uniref:kinase-associated lipoprotein B n=1 Tax=Bacillus methanolicus TaxID=1471 RepID=UPI0023807608|nr:kinase-associated lipoprotein B [Bacillus methanolicus]MDE3841160.1 kinase [Bacillus methanolicus]
MSELKIGDKVTAIYKTGKYIGEITDIRPRHFLVRILAVLKHPIQGDLHHPKEAEGVFFHERRALSFREQTNVPKQMVKPFADEIPDYMDSLKAAVEKMKEELLADGSAWAQRSLKNFESLEKDYFR